MAITDHSYAISLYDTNIANTPDKEGNKKYGDYPILHGIGLYFRHFQHPGKLFPFNAWASSIEGYKNIMKLSTLGFDKPEEIDGVKIGVIDAFELMQHKRGLLFGIGEPYFALGDAAIASRASLDAVFETYLSVLGTNNLYVELLPISITHTFAKSKNLGFQPVTKSDVVEGDLGYAITRYMFDKAKEKCLPIIPVSGAHFIDEEDKLIQDVLAKNSYASGRCYHEVYRVKKAKELFKDLKQILGADLTAPMFESWIDNTLDIANRCKDIYIKYSYQLPQIDIPAHIKEQTDSYDKQLTMLVAEKCQEHGRWNNDAVYIERFKKEMDVIAKNKILNFLPYFLMYEDIASFARSQGILAGIARGSAGGSLLSYYLKIIHIDPVATNLPFERFLSHERIESMSFPDIDWDSSNRGPVVAYLQKKYGLGFAQIATFGRMKVKTAIKDAMNALYGQNRNAPVVHHICGLIPDSPQGSDEKQFLYGHTDKEGLYHPGVIEIYPEVADFFKMYPAVKTMVDKLIGVTRGLGRHASGFVVSSKDLSDGLIPLMAVDHDGEKLYMTQMAASMVEKCGLIKADILAVNTLEMVRVATDLIKQRTGLDYMEENENGVAFIYRLPEKNKVFKAFEHADTDSSFQFNSSLIKSLLPGFKPRSIKELAALTALGRPGSLDVKVENDISATQYYIEVQNGRKPPKYIHPDLESLLKETNSVVAYQEQLMAILVIFANYTPGEADQIRSAIAKKKKEIMLKAYDKVRLETQKKGWTLEQANSLCDILSAYSNYSFNRSHSFAYAQTGYITMYLKTYHPIEWWSAVLNLEKKEETIRSFASLLGPKLAPPSINSLYSEFTPGDGVIHSPVWLVKGIGKSVAKYLADSAPYKNIEDLLKRAHYQATSATTFLAMIKGRVLDAFIDKNKSYMEERHKLINIFNEVKKSNSKGIKAEDFLNPTPLDMFITEREVNTCFNKSLVDEPMICSILEKRVKGELVSTVSKLCPYTYNGIKVVRSFNSLSNVVGSKEAFAVVCLFEGSEHRSGVSKRTGKDWSNVTVQLSDGFQTSYCVWWDRKKALGFPVNGLCIVVGTPQRDWKGRIALTIESIEVIPND